MFKMDESLLVKYMSFKKIFGAPESCKPARGLQCCAGGGRSCLSNSYRCPPGCTATHQVNTSQFDYRQLCLFWYCAYYCRLHNVPVMNIPIQNISPHTLANSAAAVVVVIGFSVQHRLVFEFVKQNENCQQQICVLKHNKDAFMFDTQDKTMKTVKKYSRSLIQPKQGPFLVLNNMQDKHFFPNFKLQ